MKNVCSRVLVPLLVLELLVVSGSGGQWVRTVVKDVQDEEEHLFPPEPDPSGDAVAIAVRVSDGATQFARVFSFAGPFAEAMASIGATGITISLYEWVPACPNDRPVPKDFRHLGFAECKASVTTFFPLRSGAEAEDDPVISLASNGLILGTRLTRANCRAERVILPGTDSDMDAGSFNSLVIISTSPSFVLVRSFVNPSCSAVHGAQARAQAQTKTSPND